MNNPPNHRELDLEHCNTCNHALRVNKCQWVTDCTKHDCVTDEWYTCDDWVIEQ